MGSLLQALICHIAYHDSSVDKSREEVNLKLSVKLLGKGLALITRILSWTGNFANHPT